MVSLLYGNKVKTTIVIDKKLWEEFKLKVSEERGIRELSQAIEELLEDEVLGQLVVRALSDMGLMGKFKSIKPLKPTNAGEAIRELRDSRS
ncbi:hypothetical protein KEJ27_06505 [Candidatus Bathyarchaeota archaeon]|nr:hypothetical protein [Candidatus Bathyarchaeota archaeon]MBS7617399.1 hypothetical protein [Candidatus Bathyarchaeota archaeon]